MMWPGVVTRLTDATIFQKDITNMLMSLLARILATHIGIDVPADWIVQMVDRGELELAIATGSIRQRNMLRSVENTELLLA